MQRYIFLKTKHEFRHNKNVTDPSKIKELTKKAEEGRQLIERQLAIAKRLYK